MKHTFFAVSIALVLLITVVVVVLWVPSGSASIAEMIAPAAAPVDPVILGHIADLKDEDHNVQYAAAEALEELGPEAEPAVPALIEALADDSGVAGHARRALEAIGQPVVEPLVAVLRHEKMSVRLHAAYTLGRLREKAKPARPALLELLTDKTYVGNWRLHQAITGQGEEVIPELIAAMDDPDFLVQLRVAGVLSRFGEKGKAAVPIFIEALEHKDAKARRSGVFYLTEMGQIAKPALPHLILRLKDDDLQLRKEVVHAVQRLGWGDARAVQALAEALQDTAIREDAAYALGEMEDPAAGPALKACLDDEHMQFRVVACWALARCKPDPQAMLPVLIEALGTEDFGDKQRAAGALRELGEDAASAVPALRDMLDSPFRDERSAAIGALNEIGPDAEGSIAALMHALDDEDYIVRLGAAGSLRRFGPKAIVAVRKLEELRDRRGEKESVRREAGLGGQDTTRPTS